MTCTVIDDNFLHDYISTVQFFNSVVIVVIIYVVIRIYTIYTHIYYPLPFIRYPYLLPLPVTLTLYPYPYPLPLPFTLTLYPRPAF